MITSNLYSMSVKELVTRLSVLLVVCAFAVSAKAMSAQPTLINGEWGFVIVVEQGDDLNGKAGPANEVSFINDFTNYSGTWTTGIYKESGSDKLILRYNQGSAYGNIYVDEIAKLILKTESGVALKIGDIDALGNKFTGLTYMDLGDSRYEANHLSEVVDMIDNKSNLKTIVFPGQDGLNIPSQKFLGSQLEVVIFADNDGSYTIGKEAFGRQQNNNTNLIKVQLGKGYTVGTTQDTNGESMFSYCTSLTSLVLDNEIHALPTQGFEYTTSLEYCALPQQLVSLGGLCFKFSGLKTVTIPDFIRVTTSSNQAFQKCHALTDVYVLTDNVPVASQGLFEMGQTQITYNGGNSYSPADYTSQESGQSVITFHYPGTETSRKNYRAPCFFHYRHVDQRTGTTWPNQDDLSNIDNGWYDGGKFYEGRANDPALNDYADASGNKPWWGNAPYAGWKQLLLGSQIIRSDNVFYDERIKHSLWYSVCYPVDMTEAQFESAYGVGADLNEFSGAVYDEEKNMITLEFKERAPIGDDGIFLRRNTPYMIHPASLNYREEKILYPETNPDGTYKRYDDGTIVYNYRKDTNNPITINGQTYYKDEAELKLAVYNVRNDLFLKLEDRDDPTAQESVMAAAETLAFAAKKARPLVKRTISVDSDGKKTYNDEEIADAPVQYTFIGSYREGMKIPAGSYYWGGRSAEEAVEQGLDPTAKGAVVPFKFYYSKSGTQRWVPFGALIMTSARGVEISNPFTSTVNTDNNQNAKSLDASFDLIMVGEPEATGVDSPSIEIPVVKSSDKVYNINGQLVRDNARDLNSLGKGIYIVGGRKIIVK